MSLRVSILGGYGGMGRIFAKLFKDEGCDVLICGPTEVKGLQAAKELGVTYEKDNHAAVQISDVVVVTVPIAVTAETIRDVAPHVKGGALFMDLTSVKEWPCQLMEKHSNPQVEIVGTHPIFGPRVGTVEGQVFVLTPVRGEKWLKWLIKILEKNKAKLIQSNPQEHDEVMAVVQGLTHFAYISVGKTLYDRRFDVRNSRRFSSPVYELMLDMVGRIIGQNPHLYAEIQMQNPKIPDIHESFLNAAKSVSQAVREKDEKKFVQMMTDAARHFGDTERSMGRSDKAISSLVSELNTLKSMAGETICLKHIYSGAIHFGIVEEVTADEVTLKIKGKSKKLKLSNLRILSEKERLVYAAEKFGTVQRDYSAIFPDSADPEFISEILGKLQNHVVKADVKDVYRGDKIAPEMKSICFSITLLRDNLKANDKAVSEFIEKIGGKLR